jgi:hypothetical protein
VMKHLCGKALIERQHAHPVYVAPRRDGNMEVGMSRSCFRSSSHHGRRANGALVMMVLNKGIE